MRFPLIHLKPWQKWTLLTIAAIVLQGVLTKLWSGVLTPGMVWTRDFLLNLATLGITSLKNDVYRQVAQGLHEQFTVRLFVFIEMMTVMLLTMMSIIAPLLLRFLAPARTLIPGDNTAESSIAIRSRYRRLRRANNTLLYVLIPVVIVSTFFTVYTAIYINAAVTHYNQLQTIIRPYSDQSTLDMFSSRFAQIRTRAEYDILIAELTTIAMKHNLLIPTFESW
jgi:hypothetical protein